MGNGIPEDRYRIIARERSHHEAKATVATNRMLVQSLILINGGAAVAALAFYGAHDSVVAVYAMLLLAALRAYGPQRTRDGKMAKLQSWVLLRNTQLRGVLPGYLPRICPPESPAL
jgi:hypothetical protein